MSKLDIVLDVEVADEEYTVMAQREQREGQSSWDVARAARETFEEHTDGVTINDVNVERTEY